MKELNRAIKELRVYRDQAWTDLIERARLDWLWAKYSADGRKKATAYYVPPTETTEGFMLYLSENVLDRAPNVWQNRAWRILTDRAERFEKSSGNEPCVVYTV